MTLESEDPQSRKPTARVGINHSYVRGSRPLHTYEDESILQRGSASPSSNANFSPRPIPKETMTTIKRKGKDQKLDTSMYVSRSMFRARENEFDMTITSVHLTPE